MIDLAINSLWVSYAVTCVWFMTFSLVVLMAQKWIDKGKDDNARA
jgi:hypothetical protein